MCRQLAEVRDREQLLKLQVRASVLAGRDAAGCEQSGANSGRMQQEATALLLQNKQLEERLQVTCSVTARLTAELVKPRSHDWCI